MKRLGVIGGLGPGATAYFLELLIKMTDAVKDQEHLDMIVYQSPWIPDRTSYILKKSKENPLPPMLDIGKSLVGQGAEVIAIPCITAHYFHRELTEGIGAPIIHLVKETAACLKKHGISGAGVMATDGTLESGLFQKELSKAGIKWYIPDCRHQQYVMDIIYQDIKAGRPADMDKFCAAEHYLRQNGAQIIILGCTELSLIKKEASIGPGFLDAMEVLAMRAILMCDAPLKGEYQCLIEEEKNA